jgi:hypothetical protein
VGAIAPSCNVPVLGSKNSIDMLSEGEKEKNEQKHKEHKNNKKQKTKKQS